MHKLSIWLPVYLELNYNHHPYAFLMELFKFLKQLFSKLESLRYFVTTIFSILKTFKSELIIKALNLGAMAMAI